MSFATDYVKAHPIIAAGSAVGTGSVAYGISHHFLDFPAPLAVAAGVASGTSIVLAEAVLWDTWTKLGSGKSFVDWLGSVGLLGVPGLIYEYGWLNRDKVSVPLVSVGGGSWGGILGDTITKHVPDSEAEKAAYAALAADPTNKAKQKACVEAYYATHQRT